jgi:S1-C subfamily serine protease
MDAGILKRTAGLIGAAVLGGAAALGGASLTGGLDRHTTTVRELLQSPSSSRSGASFSDIAKPLTINAIYRRSSPGVVQVTATSIVTPADNSFFGNPFGGPEQQVQRAEGSGFVWDKAGHIVTNYHVVQGAKSVEVSFSNRDTLKARIVGVDPSTDVAVLKVAAHSRALTPLSLGNSDQLRVGDSVVAIGNPFGLDRSVTAGIVSALQRQIQAPNPNTSIDHVIQTDAAINHGNSGGPLLNAQGQVVGVNAQIETGSVANQGNVGIGFAIPINTVRNVVAQLIRSGKVEHAFLGIGGHALDPNVARTFHLPVQTGVLVERVQKGTGAGKAGLRGGTTAVVVAGESWRLGGDIIVAADGVPVGSVDRLRDVVATKKPGETMTLQIYRGDKKLSLDVKLGRLPTSPQS